jgi:uncharacterized protein (TIGR03435 family)
MSPGKFRVENWPLKKVIMFAYDLRTDSQISGYPTWVNSTEYDIDAKTDENTAAALVKLPPDQYIRQVKLMVQALLAERFHLRVSYQAKEIPVYALVIASGGPKLMKSTGPLLLTGGGTRSGIMMEKRGEVQGINSSLDEFAAAVPNLMPEVGNRVVVNKTGLTGSYNWTLKWTPESTAQNFGEPNDGTPPPADSGDSAPGLFTTARCALQYAGEFPRTVRYKSCGDGRSAQSSSWRFLSAGLVRPATAKEVAEKLMFCIRA